MSRRSGQPKKSKRPSSSKRLPVTTARFVNDGGDVVAYEALDGEVQLDVRLERETVWLSQQQMALLFKTSTDNINLHLKNIYKDGELEELATTEDYSVVQKEGRRGVRRKLKHYNLDAIISVGYRVNSKRGVQFRIWATGTLDEFSYPEFPDNCSRRQNLRD